MIRLQRIGRKHEPVFRLVLTDSKNGPKSGKFLEILGSFDARRGEKAVFDGDRIKQLISKGAKLSDTVHNLLVGRKIIEGKKINVLPRKAPTPTSETVGEPTENVGLISTKPTEAAPTSVVEAPTESVGVVEEKTL